MGQRSRAPRNRTVNLSPEETSRLLERVVTLGPKDVVEAPTDGIHSRGLPTRAEALPERFVDLLFLDPPYNLDKDFNGLKFSRTTVIQYSEWLREVLHLFLPVAEAECHCVHLRRLVVVTGRSFIAACEEGLIVRNRIYMGT